MGASVEVGDEGVIFAVFGEILVCLKTKNVAAPPTKIAKITIIKICLKDTVNVIIFLMKRKALILILAMIPMFLFSVTTPVMAAKKRVWKATTTTVSTGGSSKFSVSARLTGWKQYLNINFRGVTSTTGVNYELIYTGSNTEQGVYGSVKASEGNTSRSLFLGTCSHGACTSHKNISNMRLTITYKTNDGQSVTKRYKVKY